MTTEPTARESGKPVVLAADDSRSVQLLITKTLDRTYEVITVPDGASALHKVKSLHPDVVVSDINMPFMDGISLCETLKKDPDTRQIPIILLTGIDESTALVNSLQRGADDYLRKPIGPEELLARVDAAYRSHMNYKKLETSHQELEKAHQKLAETQGQLVQVQKLEAIGRLAAGVAHEMNTPLQYVSDNATFLDEAFKHAIDVLDAYRELTDTLRQRGGFDDELAKLDKIIEDADLDYHLEEIPNAIEQSRSGIRSLAEIVCAMKEFSHPGAREKTPSDINALIRNTITVARNEWKYHAEVETELDPNLPEVPVLPAEFNQVVLNLIVNAAHAIADVVRDDPGKLGTITISTHLTGDDVEVRIRDDGAGIPRDVREKIFDPFFTTKEVGRGSGQGLAISRSVIVDKHGGDLYFNTKIGKGTCFVMRLPVATNDDDEGGEPDGDAGFVDDEKTEIELA